MQAVVQRVTESSVSVGRTVCARIGNGLMVLLAVAQEDREQDADYLAPKIAHLRIFQDEHGKMNRSLIDIGGEMLVVSQFTLLGDCRKGRRPSFAAAAAPDQARTLYERFAATARLLGLRVETGRFGADMSVSLTNDGPVTLIVTSR